MLPTSTYTFRGGCCMKKISTKTMSLIAVLVVVALGQGIPSTGLVAFYSFTGAGNYTDGSGNGNNLYPTVPAAAPKPMLDRFNTASAADSFYNSFLVGSARSLPSGDSDRTFSFWVKPRSFNYITVQNLLYYGDTIAGKYCKIEITNEGIANRLHVSNGLSDFNVLCGPGTLVENWWNHLAVTITKSKVRIYINNRLDTAGLTTGWNTTKDSLVVGARKRIAGGGYTMSTANFWGGIDDISVYNRALSAEQVLQLFNAKSTIESTALTHGRCMLQTMPLNNENRKQWYNIQGKVLTNGIRGIRVSSFTKVILQ